MVEGIIYKYTSPSGRCYIGQTTNEKHRRATWFCEKYRYAGPKIDRARKKYGPTNFLYEILHRKFYFNKAEATIDLDKWEIYYIGYYDSYRNGYNSTIGGLSNRGIKMTEERRNKLRLCNLGRKQSLAEIQKRATSLRGIRHTKAAVENSKRLRRSSGKLKKVYQFSLDGILIKEWKCISEASEALNISLKNIYRSVKTLGVYQGSYWRDSSIFKLKERKGNFKVVYQKSLDGTHIRTYSSVAEAARSLNKLPTLISRCLNGKRDEAYGYIWTFNL